jgi:hypothetical protein
MTQPDGEALPILRRGAILAAGGFNEWGACIGESCSERNV